MNPLINILIRTSNRPNQFDRCIQSVFSQEYDNMRIIISVDNEAALDYIPEDVDTIIVKPGSGPFHYNLYCNELMSKVTDGYFFFLDDDDRLLPNALNEIAPHLSGDGVICQMMRADRRKPTDSRMRQRIVQQGHIGMPCIIAHHSLKGLVKFTATEDADYRFIEELNKKALLKWVAIPVVSSEQRGHGVMEQKIFAQ